MPCFRPEAVAPNDCDIHLLPSHENSRKQRHVVFRTWSPRLLRVGFVSRRPPTSIRSMRPRCDETGRYTAVDSNTQGQRDALATPPCMQFPAVAYTSNRHRMVSSGLRCPRAAPPSPSRLSCNSNRFQSHTSVHGCRDPARTCRATTTASPTSDY